MGDKLPPVRKLAAELVVNPNTVAKAYKLLERQGLVRTRTGAGTFVTAPAHRDRDAIQLSILAERIDNIITQGVNLGLSPSEITELFTSRLARFTPPQEKGTKENE